MASSGCKLWPEGLLHNAEATLGIQLQALEVGVESAAITAAASSSDGAERGNPAAEAGKRRPSSIVPRQAPERGRGGQS